MMIIALVVVVLAINNIESPTEYIYFLSESNFGMHARLHALLIIGLYNNSSCLNNSFKIETTLAR